MSIQWKCYYHQYAGTKLAYKAFDGFGRILVRLGTEPDLGSRAIDPQHLSTRIVWIFGLRLTMFRGLLVVLIIVRTVVGWF